MSRFNGYSLDTEDIFEPTCFAQSSDLAEKAHSSSPAENSLNTQPANAHSNNQVHFDQNSTVKKPRVLKPRTIFYQQPVQIFQSNSDRELVVQRSPEQNSIQIVRKALDGSARTRRMAEDLSEQESPSLQAPEDLSTSNTIKITIDEDEGEETSIEPQQVNSNSVEKEVNSSQVMHDHNYGNCKVSLNSGDPYYGSNGEPFPLLEGLGDYVDGQTKNSLPQKTAHSEHHPMAARTIRTSVGGPITSMNFVDPKQREEMLKRRSAGNMINRPREDVFVLSGRAFDNNRLIEQKKLQPTTLVNKFPLRSAIKPGGFQQGGVALSRQFGSPNSVTASPDQHNTSITFYQQRQPHRAQQPIILKATPRILQPVPPNYRRQPIQRQAVPSRKQATEEESALLDVVNEEEMRNQKFFQKQIGNQQNSVQQQMAHNTQAQPQRQVTTSISTVPGAEESTDPHGYFHKFQSVRHQPTNLIQSPPRQDFARQGYAAPPKPFYQSPQNQQQFGRLAQPAIGTQPPQFMAQEHQVFAGQQPNSFQSQSPVRPRVRKPLIETTESPQRTPKVFTTPATAPKSSTRGRKKKDPDEKKSAKKQQNASYNENDVFGDVEGVDYVTRCICEMKHNDPNMIACDVCDVWQHMACMGIDSHAKTANANADYKCEKCRPRPLKYNREQAAAIQRKYLATSKEKAARGRKSQSKTPKSAKETNRIRSNSDVHHEKQRRSSVSAAAVSKPESKFIETKISRGVRKILDKLSPGDEELQAKMGNEPLVQTLVVAPSVYGVVSKGDIEAGNPIFEYKASLSLRDERGSQTLTSKFFGNLIYVVPDNNGSGAELIFADSTRHSDPFSSKLRKSCQPNAEIRHFISKDRDNEDLLRLFVVARESIEDCTEITIPLDLEYRGAEISEIDCACKTANYSSQAGGFTDGCPVAAYLQSKQNGQQQPKQESSPPKAVRKPPASSPPKQKAERRRTTSNQVAAVTQPVAQKEEPKSEVSPPPPTKTPTPMAEELEIASILTQDLPRSSSNTGTAKSLTSSPTRRSPVKSGITKKVGDKPAKKTATKAKKESTGETKKKPPTPRKSDGVSREMASLFDDNKFMSSSLEFEDVARGRSLRQRAQIKKEEPETPTPSTSAKTPTSGRKRQHSQTTTPSVPAKQPKRKSGKEEVEVKQEPAAVTPEQLQKALGKSMTFTLSSRLFDLAKKSKRTAA